MKNISLFFNARSLVLLLFLFTLPELCAQTIDSDGDGVVDQLDLDDDNDGIPDSAECSITPVNMVNWMNSSSTLPGDVQSGYASFISAQNSTAGGGLVRNWISPANYQQLSQIGATSEASAISSDEFVEYKVTVGSRYLVLNQVEYYITGSGTNSTTYNYTVRMSVDNFATNTIVHGPQTYAPVAAGANYIVNTAQTLYLYPNTTYSFRVYFYNVAGGNSGAVAHDDFKLRGAFECDADGDNLPNRLDLDSDNDGCFDAIEGDENVLLNQLTSGRINIATTGGIGTTAGSNNGVPNLVNPNGSADVGGDVGQGVGDSQNNRVNSQCIDTDGDGIQNDFDLDDDNDGITDTLEDSCEFEGSPVYNNNFGTGVTTGSDSNVVNHSFQAQSPNDGQYTITTSNAQTAAHVRTELNGNLDAGNPNIAAGSTDGRYLMINVNSPVTVNQAIYRVSNLSVITGGRYRFRIDMAGLSGAGTAVPNVQLSIKDTSGNILATANSGNIGLVNDDVWRRLTLNFTATTGTVVLEIVNLQANGSGNDLGIDNVILTPLNICDVDGDGIPNSQDLDSDNDGCTDAIEGGASFTNTNLVTATGALAVQSPNQNLGNTVSTAAATLGIPTVAGTGQSVGQSQDWTRNDCIDSDGDGIPNWQDLDDDNDGIPDTLEDTCQTEGTPVFLNDFGTGGRTSDARVLLHTYVASGNIPDGSYSVTRSLDASSTFSQTERTGNLDAGNPVISAGSTDGRYLMINMSGLASMNQPIYRVSNLSTAIGGRYRFRIDMAGLSDGVIPIVKLVLKDTSGNTLATSNSVNIGVLNDDIWRRLTLDFVATTSSVTLEVVNLQSENGGNDLGIDNVILTPLNICDNDGDGIPNSLDLDSDGDGCTDAIEGGAAFSTVNLVTATGPITSQTPNQNLGNTVGGTGTTLGIPTVAGTGQSAGESQNSLRNDCTDSDGDGIPNWQDLDDDNDGILDTVECPPTNVFANFGAAAITNSTPNSSVSNITFGSVTGTLARVFNGTTGGPIGVVASDLSNGTVYTPAGSATQSTLSEFNSGYKGTNNFTRYTLTLSAPVESITLQINGFDYMKTRFVGNHVEQLLSGGTEFVYNSTTRQLYDINPLTTGVATRDGFGSVRITSRDGLPFTQIIYEKFDDPNSTSGNLNTSDGFNYTFSIVPSCDTDGDGIPNSLDLDSDGDGCSDAIEGGANITGAQLVTAGGNVLGGSTGVDQNLCATGTCVNVSGVPQFTTVPAGYSNTAGQTVGDSQNALVNLCYCYKKPVLDAGSNAPVQHGITALNRAGSGNSDWPTIRQSAWTVLEAKTKGFVVNRLAFEDADFNAATPTTPVGIPAANFIEGMMVYDTVANCLKIYNGTVWNCYSTQTCPQ